MLLEVEQARVPCDVVVSPPPPPPLLGCSVVADCHNNSKVAVDYCTDLKLMARVECACRKLVVQETRAIVLPMRRGRAS